MPRPYEALEEVIPGNARVLSCPVDILPPIAGWAVDASTAPWSGSTPTGPGTNKRAVFDTGAMHTVINRGLANQISLPRARRITVHTANGEAECWTYHACVRLPNMTYPFITVIEADTPGCDVLIGMDIIAENDFRIWYRPSADETRFRFSRVRG